MSFIEFAEICLGLRVPGLRCAAQSGENSIIIGREVEIKYRWNIVGDIYVRSKVMEKK